MTLNEFIKKMEDIKKKGFIKTHRAGTTGIGKTLEDLLGIKENNISGPDFGEFELKSMRNNSKSMLTLITKSPDIPKNANSFLRINYGYVNENNGVKEQILHATLDNVNYTKISNTGHYLKIAVDDYFINIINESNEIISSWHINTVVNSICKKIAVNQIILVKAQNRGHGINEEFYYNEVYLLKDFNPESFIQLICDGRIKIDLRIGQYHKGPNTGKTHDHGTAFRIFEKDHNLLFNIERLI